VRVASVTMPVASMTRSSARLWRRLTMRVPAVAMAVAMTMRVGVFRRGHSGMKAQLWRLAKAGAQVSPEVAGLREIARTLASRARISDQLSHGSRHASG
jgi:hypothetical protein